MSLWSWHPNGRTSFSPWSLQSVAPIWPLLPPVPTLLLLLCCSAIHEEVPCRNNKCNKQRNYPKTTACPKRSAAAWFPFRLSSSCHCVVIIPFARLISEKDLNMITTICWHHQREERDEHGNWSHNNNGGQKGHFIIGGWADNKSSESLCLSPSQRDEELKWCYCCPGVNCMVLVKLLPTPSSSAKQSKWPVSVRFFS